MTLAPSTCRFRFFNMYPKDGVSYLCHYLGSHGHERRSPKIRIARKKHP
jgi:hypothetical protein